MPVSSTAKEVKESVLNLSVDHFEEYSKRLPTVAEATFRRANLLEIDHTLQIAQS